MTTNLDQKREEAVEKLLDYAVEKLLDYIDSELSYFVWTDNEPRTVFRQVLQSYGTLVEQQTREKVIEKITSWICSPYTSGDYKDGVSPERWMKKLRELKEEKPQLDRDEQATPVEGVSEEKHPTGLSMMELAQKMDDQISNLHCLHCGKNPVLTETDKDKP